MYKNQLQELAQRSCFNLPSYSCVREGPDHAPRFKASVNFNGETFESPTFCSTLRQTEHAAAEVALNKLANRGPSRALAARVLDETGVYKNLLQETAHRAGLSLPVYTTVRSGPAHVPVFSCTVELAGLSFSGEPAKTKKQAQKNAAMAAWSALKQMTQCNSTCTAPSSSSSESQGSDKQKQDMIARILASLQRAESKSSQNDCHSGKPRSISASWSPNSATAQLYPMQHEIYAYLNFSAEMAVYRTWQQAQLSQLQSYLLSMPILPSPLLNPHVFPFMQSMIQPDHLYFSARELEPIPNVVPVDTIAASRPSLYFPNPSVPTPTRGRSMVTIQEIQEEKTDGLTEFCPSEPLNSPVPGDGKSKLGVEEAVQKLDKQKCLPESKIGESGKWEDNRTGQFDFVSRTIMKPGSRPIEFQLQNPSVNESSWSTFRPHHSPRPHCQRIFESRSSATAPARIRTVGPVSSGGCQAAHMANRMLTSPEMRTGIAPGSTRPGMGYRVPPRFMAPAVQIRSVVPVCSAPPPRKILSSIQEAQSSNPENRNGGQDNVSAVSSELSKLRT